MKTDDMISMLAAHVAPVDGGEAARRYRWAILLGGLGSLVLMQLLFGVRPDIGAMTATPLFWFKLAFPACFAASALLLSTRLSRPGVSMGHGWQLLATPLVILWLAAAVVIGVAPAPERLPMILGQTWHSCPYNIALLSIPTFIGIFWAIKGLAPTRLRTAGAVGGFLAGSIATTVYCLHCPEMALPFWAVWYLAGLLIPTAFGALLAPRLLRW